MNRIVYAKDQVFLNKIEVLNVSILLVGYQNKSIEKENKTMNPSSTQKFYKIPKQIDINNYQWDLQ